MKQTFDAAALSRWFVILLLLASSSAVTHAGGNKIYRHVDESGNITYSDEPLDASAEEVDLPPLSVVQIDVLSKPDASGPIPPEVAAQATTTVEQVDYAFLRFASPEDQSSFTGHEDRLTVRLEIQPELSPQHQIRYALDGKTIATERTLTFTYDPVYRGQHVLSAAVVDRRGSVLEAAQPITIYHHKNSLNSPARRGPGGGNRPQTPQPPRAPGQGGGFRP